MVTVKLERRQIIYFAMSHLISNVNANVVIAPILAFEFRSFLWVAFHPLQVDLIPSNDLMEDNNERIRRVLIIYFHQIVEK